MLVSAIGQTKQQTAKLVLQCHINSFDTGGTWFYICWLEVPGSRPKENPHSLQHRWPCSRSTQLQVKAMFAVVSIRGIGDSTEGAALQHLCQLNVSVWKKPHSQMLVTEGILCRNSFTFKSCLFTLPSYLPMFLFSYCYYVYLQLPKDLQ